jgi:hypothetical protein
MEDGEWKIENRGLRIEDGRKGVFKFIRELNYPGL